MLLKQGIEETVYYKKLFVMTLSIEFINCCFNFLTLYTQHSIRIVQYQTPLFLSILEVHIWFRLLFYLYAITQL